MTLTFLCSVLLPVCSALHLVVVENWDLNGTEGINMLLTVTVRIETWVSAFLLAQVNLKSTLHLARLMVVDLHKVDRLKCSCQNGNVAYHVLSRLLLISHLISVTRCFRTLRSHNLPLIPSD